MVSLIDTAHSMCSKIPCEGQYSFSHFQTGPIEGTRLYNTLELSGKGYRGRRLLQMALSLLIVIDGQRGAGALFVLLCLTIVVAVISARRTGMDAPYFLRPFLDFKVARKADHIF